MSIVLKNTKVEVVVKVDYTDVEAAIREVYGKDYEIMPMEGGGSSQYAATYTQSVNKGELDTYAQAGVASFKAGKNEQFILSALLRDMANNDQVMEGEYIISVSW